METVNRDASYTTSFATEDKKEIKQQPASGSKKYCMCSFVNYDGRKFKDLKKKEKKTDFSAAKQSIDREISMVCCHEIFGTERPSGRVDKTIEISS